MSEWTDSDGNSLGDWVTISREEYDSIFMPDLKPFATLTDIYGKYGPPQVYTAWGREGADIPLLDIRDWKDENGFTERQVCRKFVPAVPSHTGENEK